MASRRARRHAHKKGGDAVEDNVKASARDFSQRKEEASIFVSDELDRAIERCRSKVERLAKECRRRNRRFRDIEFDLEGDQWSCLYGLCGKKDEDEDPKGVRRASSMFNEPIFFSETGHPGRRVMQGRLGDCWFLSALATVGTIPRLIEQICVARDEAIGIYGFIFYGDQGWVDVIIDDFLCTKAPRYEELSSEQRGLYQSNQSAYESIGRQGSKALHFSASGDENETWVPLIEKAYAKLYGDYAALEGGFNTDALEDLTGGVSDVISLVDILEPDRLWRDELLKVGEDRLLGCYIQGISPNEDSEQTVMVNGLIQSHEYSVIAAMEVAGKKFVKLRNPWGKVEWSGPWSDGSQEWTMEWLHRLPELKHSFANDGEFLMEYKDFLKTWTAIGRTRLFDSTWLLSSQWLNVTSRSFPCAWNFGDVTFTISVTEPTPAIIVLSKINTRGWQGLDGPFLWSFDYAIYARGALEPLCTATPSRLWRRTLSIEVDLEPGEYVVQVRLDRCPRGGVQDSSDWNPRKLSRKAASAAISKSLASNFDSRQPGNFLPIPASYFTGQDLTAIELAQSSEGVIPMLAPLDPSTILSDEPASMGDGNATGGANESDSNTASSSGMDGDSSKDEAAVHHPSEDQGGTPKESSGPDTTNTSMTLKGDNGEVVHVNFGCNGCGESPIVGTRYHCLDPTCPNTDFCQKCVDADGHPKQHALLRLNMAVNNDTEGLRSPSPALTSSDQEAPPGGPVHEHFSCNICKDSPIVGPRYHCLDSDCSDFDMCQKCIDSDAHPSSHQVLRINSPEDDHSRNDNDDDDDTITLGLRVYTKKIAPATVRGQLRHGKVLKWKRVVASTGGEKATEGQKA